MTALETLAERLARLLREYHATPDHSWHEKCAWEDYSGALYDAHDAGELVTRAEAARLVAEAVDREREGCARFVDCGCDPTKKAIAANGGNSGDRWRACQEANCGAQNIAAAIRARADRQTEGE